MHFKRPTAKARKAILGVLLIGLIAQSMVITPAQQGVITTQQQELTAEETAQFQFLEAEFAAELTEVYNETGNQQQVIAAATQLAEEMALEATSFEPVELDPFFFDPWGGDFPEVYGGDDTWRRRQQCRSQKLEECRQTYNAELFASAAVTTAIFAGCLALTGGSAFVLCVAAALAHHALNIAAAKQRYSACVGRANYECQNL